MQFKISKSVGTVRPLREVYMYVASAETMAGPKTLGKPQEDDPEMLYGGQGIKITIKIESKKIFNGDQ